MTGRYEKLLDVSGDIAEFVGNETRKLALRIDRRVVLETPVDTGAARGNWLASESNPDNSVIYEIESASTAAMIAIDNAAVVIEGIDPYTLLYIQNNLPYIVPLNEGWSLQAPALYVDAIIMQEVARK